MKINLHTSCASSAKTRFSAIFTDRMSDRKSKWRRMSYIVGKHVVSSFPLDNLF